MRLVEFLRPPAAQELKETKGPKGEPIAFVSIPLLFSACNFVVVGDTDIVALFPVAPHPDFRKRPLAQLEEILEVRAGKKDSILKGPVGELLKQAPAQAVALAVGEVSKETREKVKQRGAKSDPRVPQRFIVYAIRANGLKISGQATMADADEARMFASSVKELIDQGREGLKNPPPELKLPRETLALLNKTLDGVKVEARDAVVALDITLSAELIEAVQKLIEAQVKK
jgi:hypothetical protein